MDLEIEYLKKGFFYSFVDSLSLWFGNLRNQFLECVGFQVPSTEVRKEAFFIELMEKYGDVINGICFSYAKSGTEYEDLRQDSLINIWRGLHTFRGDANIKTWIYRVTLNTCVSVYRKSSTRPHDFTSLESVALLSEADVRDDVEQLHAALSQLTALDRAIVLLWLDERSYEEIADEVGVNRNTVATRFRRAKEKLKVIYSQI